MGRGQDRNLTAARDAQQGSFTFRRGLASRSVDQGRPNQHAHPRGHGPACKLDRVSQSPSRRLCSGKRLCSGERLVLRQRLLIKRFRPRTEEVGWEIRQDEAILRCRELPVSQRPPQPAVRLPAPRESSAGSLAQ